MILHDNIEALFNANTGNSQCKVGIMGGTFNPVHMGHLYCAEQALDACELDAVVFIPAGNPSFKHGQRLASIEDRMKMCELATSSNPRFFVSDLEAKDSCVTYTIDTMRRLRAAAPENISFEFIIGTDSFLTLRFWRDAKELASLCGFICVGRPYEIDETDIACEAERMERAGFRINIVEAPMIDISSSDIRNRISEGRSIRYIVPESVRDYIYANNLYDYLWGK